MMDHQIDAGSAHGPNVALAHVSAITLMIAASNPLATFYWAQREVLSMADDRISSVGVVGGMVAYLDALRHVRRSPHLIISCYEAIIGKLTCV